MCITLTQNFSKVAENIAQLYWDDRKKNIFCTSDFNKGKVIYKLELQLLTYKVSIVVSLRQVLQNAH